MKRSVIYEIIPKTFLLICAILIIPTAIFTLQKDISNVQKVIQAIFGIVSLIFIAIYFAKFKKSSIYNSSRTFSLAVFILYCFYASTPFNIKIIIILMVIFIISLALNYICDVITKRKKGCDFLFIKRHILKLSTKAYQINLNGVKQLDESENYDEPPYLEKLILQAWNDTNVSYSLMDDLIEAFEYDNDTDKIQSIIDEESNEDKIIEVNIRVPN